MAKKGHQQHEEHMDESWLIPYADLLTLLLALFIVLFASSNVDKEKYSAIAKAFFNEFGGNRIITQNGGADTSGLPDDIYIPSPPPVSPEPTPSDESFENYEMERLQALQEDLENYFADEGLIAQINMHIDERGLVISLNDSVLFDPGKAIIKPGYTDMLVRMGSIINKLDNYIRVEGHTDSVPIHTEKFDSNWELSSVRATTVVKLFIRSSGIVPEKLVAVGYGEYKPVADNATAEGRAQNRRVDVIILSGKFNSLEDDHSQSESAT